MIPSFPGRTVRRASGEGQITADPTRKGELIMKERRTPSFYAVLPASVRYDKKLIPNAKLLYAEITALQEANGYCFAFNDYFAELYGLKPATITSLLKNLKDNGYIEVEIVRDVETKQVLQRKIATTNKLPVIADPSPKNIGDPSQKNIEDPPQEISGNSISCFNESITPHSPPKRGRRDTEPKKVAEWKPEIFERFWRLYPRGEKRPRAIAAWDRLKPSDELIVEMSNALKRQISSEEWQRGIGIPHPATWINQRRWEDEVKSKPSMSKMDTGGGLEQW